MKYVTLLLILVGTTFIAIGSFQHTSTYISQKMSLKEANKMIKKSEHKLGYVGQIEQPPTLGEIVGIFQFPSINEELPIIEGTDEDDLEKGVGHYTGSSFPNEKGQIVLSGHRDTVFRRLGELKLGDILKIATSYGTFSYKIENTQIVEADDRSIITLQKNEEILTVTTCYPFSFIGNAPQRYIITAKPFEKNKK
jgi:sortase A